MPIIVSIQKHDNRTVLRIESGYRAGQLMEINNCIMYFSSPEKASQWAKETGYTVFKAYDETVENQHNKDYQKLLNRKCSLPKGAVIYAAK